MSNGCGEEYKPPTLRVGICLRAQVGEERHKGVKCTEVCKEGCTETQFCLIRLRELVSPAIDRIYDSLLSDSTDIVDSLKSFEDNLAQLSRQVALIKTSLRSFGYVLHRMKVTDFFEYGQPRSRTWACGTATHAIHTYLIPGVALLINGLPQSNVAAVNDGFVALNTGFVMITALRSILLDPGLAGVEKQGGKRSAKKADDGRKSEVLALTVWMTETKKQLQNR